MYVKSLSPSGYNTYEDCPMKFFLGNVLYIRSKSNIAADQGTIIHAFFEILALNKKAQQDSSDVIQHEVFGEDPVPSQPPMEINLESLLDQCWEYYTSLPSMSHHTFTDKHRKQCWEWIQPVLNSEDDPRILEIVATEHKFRIPIKKPWARYTYDVKGEIEKGYFCVTGIIDLIVKDDDNAIRFIDWKSGKRKCWITGKVKDYEYLQQDPQLLIYYWALRQLYPNVDHIVTTIWYLKDGGPFSLVFGDAGYRKIEKMVKERFEDIKHTCQPKLNKSWKCSRWCYYGTTKSEMAPLEYRQGQIDPPGTEMCLCSEYSVRIKAKGINKVTHDFFKQQNALLNQSSDEDKPSG